MDQEKEDNEPQISLKPIGWVCSDIKEPGYRRWDKVVSEVVLDPEFSEAAEGLEKFSHIVVLYWMHRIPSAKRSRLKLHPQHREDLPLLGVLATRAPARPNPIGVGVAQLLEHKGNVLKVKGLDAIDGSPVIDIKPYTKQDAVAHIRVPNWVSKL